MARTFTVVAIEGWSDGEGGWTANTENQVGTVTFDKWPTEAQIVQKLKDEGFLKDHVGLISYGKRHRSRRVGKPFVRVEDTGNDWRVEDAWTGEPIFDVRPEEDEDFGGGGGGHKRKAKPPRDPDVVEGYIKSAQAGTPLTDWKGKPTGWKLRYTVKEYRNQHGDKSAAAVLYRESKDVEPDADGDQYEYAGGYLLIDNGELFRGKRADDADDAQIVAKSEADYWGRLDTESEEASEGDNFEGAGCSGTAVCR